MAQETNPSQAPLLCSTGCGFYGSPRNDGMCSVCYKDFLQRQNGNGCVGPAGSSSDSSVGECFLAQSSNSASSQTATSPEDAQSGPRSGLSTALTAPAEERTSGATHSVTAASSPGSSMSDRAAALVSEQGGQCAAGSSGTACSAHRKGATEKKGFQKGRKRKVEEEEAPESVDVKRASPSPVSALEEPEEKPKAKKGRCFTCRKKVGFPEFYCRCGQVFCSAHRYSDVHDCTFDYKAEAAEKLRKENPVIVGEKIQRI